jgi:pimeloyl-ACP methyl ester carboxylesterase
VSPVTITIKTHDGLELPLHRYPLGGEPRPGPSVLLVHGGSASAETFTTPARSNLVAYLNQHGFDVWALDWRGSNKVAGTQASAGASFSMNAAAANDLPAAFRHIRAKMHHEARDHERLGAVGHCLGGGLLAAAISSDDPETPKVTPSNVVLSALGLFYAAPWDGCVKVQDYIIEQVLGRHPVKSTVDLSYPNAVFPPPMDASYAMWPKALRIDCGCEICHQLTFMFGHPFLEKNLVAGIHDDATLAHLFNRMDLTLYKHCGQNLRRGVYAPLDASEDLRDLSAAERPNGKRFTMPVTLITGEQNMLWHRESIDRMYDWLRSNGRRDCVKHVLPEFAHQDLLWGTRSETAVFPKILEGLLR